MRHRPLLFTLAVALSSLASAQTALDLQSAVSRALSSGPDVASARNTLEKAQADLKAKSSDPTTLIADLSSAQQTVRQNLAALSATRLSTAQTVLNQYFALHELQQTLSLNAAQVSLDQRNLTIAQAKLAAKNATPLDVDKARNTLSSDTQTLNNNKAQLSVYAAQLAKTLGLPTGTPFTLKAPPAAPKLSLSLDALGKGLSERLSSVVQAQNTVSGNQLQVRLADNDYTPKRTLEDARISLQNAQSDLESAVKSAGTTLRDAYRSYQDALEQVRLSGQSLTNQQKTLTQTQAKFSVGTAAQVDVQSAQVATSSAQLNLLKAQNNVWKALATLSVSSGLDLMGLVPGLK